MYVPQVIVLNEIHKSLRRQPIRNVRNDREECCVEQRIEIGKDTAIDNGRSIYCQI